MEVDPDRHLPSCQLLTEAQNRLRHLWLEVRARAGVFPGKVGGPSPWPQHCPVCMQQASPWDPGRALATRALTAKEGLNL